MRKSTALHLAIQDVAKGLLSWRIWLLLGWQDIRLRYRRSTLGPLWITLSMAVTIYSLGILYSHLWKTTTADYMLYLASGLLAWSLLSSIVNESTQIFLEARAYLLQMPIPFSVFIMRLFVRNFIIFFHNMLAVLPLLVYYHCIGWHLLLLIPGLLLIFMALFSCSIVLGMINLRFRDIGQLIISLMGLAMFVTPVMWVPANLPAKYLVFVEWNPFAQFVDLVRAPLMGQLPDLHAIKMLLFIFVLGMVWTLWFFSRYRHRIIFWL